MKRTIALCLICAAVAGCAENKPQPVSVTYTANVGPSTMTSPTYPYPPAEVCLPMLPAGSQWICHTNLK